MSSYYVDYPTALTVTQESGHEATCGDVYGSDEAMETIEFEEEQYVMGVRVCCTRHPTTTTIVLATIEIFTNTAVYGPYGLSSCTGAVYTISGYDLVGI